MLLDWPRHDITLVADKISWCPLSPMPKVFWVGPYRFPPSGSPQVLLPCCSSNSAGRRNNPQKFQCVWPDCSSCRLWTHKSPRNGGPVDQRPLTTDRMLRWCSAPSDGTVRPKRLFGRRLGTARCLSSNRSSPHAKDGPGDKDQSKWRSKTYKAQKSCRIYWLYIN